MEEKLNMDKLETHSNVDSSTFEELKSDIIEKINSIENVPFTIQRLCELILSSRAHYRLTDKFIRGLTNGLSVIATIGNEENKIYIEPSRNELTKIESYETPTSSQITNGSAVPHTINDNDSTTLESQETQGGSTTNTQLDNEMEQDEEDDDGVGEEEDKLSSSPLPSTSLTDESSTSSDSNSTPSPSTADFQDSEFIEIRQEFK